MAVQCVKVCCSQGSVPSFRLRQTSCDFLAYKGRCRLAAKYGNGFATNSMRLLRNQFENGQ